MVYNDGEELSSILSPNIDMAPYNHEQNSIYANEIMQTGTIFEDIQTENIFEMQETEMQETKSEELKTDQSQIKRKKY